MESDCVTLIKALSSTDPSRASWLEIITEIKELSRLLLSVVSPMFEVWQTKVLFLNICRLNFFYQFWALILFKIKFIIIMYFNYNII
jgi:hypothetical protein